MNVESPFRDTTGKRMRILVAYDGSEHADFMLDDLRHAGLPAGAVVLVLSVAERWLPPPDGESATSPERLHGNEFALDLAEGAAARLMSAFPSWSVSSEGSTGSPAATIVERAQEWNADLITLGSLGHSALERILIGSVSCKVANEASCSVRVCRKGELGHHEKVRIVLGHDGMPGASAAVRSVAGRTWPNGATVKLVTSVGFGYSPVADLNVREDYDRAREILAPAERSLREAGLDVTVTVPQGDPKLTIIDEANKLRTDSIFIGHNDRGLAYRIFIGSVASAVISRAPCSVEIVRPKNI